MRSDILQQAQAIRASMTKVTESLTDAQALKLVELYPFWVVGMGYEVDIILRHEGELYRCVQAHTSQAGWEPPNVQALWVKIADPYEEWPEWVPSTGAHDAYAKGTKVSHGGKHWMSDIDANPYEPGVHGWTEVAA